MESLKTIALISVHSDPANEMGSQNIYVRQLGEALSRLGWQVDMFTRKTNPKQADIVQHNPACRTIRLVAGTQKLVSRQQLIGYLPEFIKQWQQFQQKNQLQYSLIHTNYWLSAWVGMELKKTQPFKHFHTYHSIGAVKYSLSYGDTSNVDKTRLAIEKACLETADLTIATCPQQRDYLRELVSDQGQIEIVPCGTDINLFGSVSYSRARRKLALAADVFNVLYVGKLNSSSGIETLIKAIGKPQLHGDTNISLTLIDSTGASRSLLRQRTEKLVWDAGLDKITTIVAGLNRQELATYYAAADVCVVPSQYNPSGMVALEAMASGTPVIASNLGGLKYVVIPEQTGLLYPAQNSFLLTRAIYHLATKPKMRSQFSIASRSRVEELFGWDTVAEQISELYDEQIKQQNLSQLHESWQSSLRAV